MRSSCKRYGAGRDEAGVTTLEFVLIAPALITLIFGIIQFSLWYYAGEVARTAATSGATAGATANAGVGAARTEANTVLAGPGGGIVHASQVAVTPQGPNMTVTVTGHATSLVLGLTLDVHATSSEPIEQFSPETRP